MPQPIADFSSQVYALVLAHAWVALSAVVIGGAIRVLKSDTPLPTIPAKYRTYAALVFGLASGVVQAIMSGTPWLLALLQGLGAGGAAIVGHQVLIEGARDGKELFSKSPGVAAASSAAKIAGSIILIAFLAGCSASQVRAALPVGLELEQMACVFAQGELGQTEPKAIALACSTPPSAIESVVNALLAQKKGHALAAAAKASAK